VARTPDDTVAPLDAVFVADGALVAAAEIKSRTDPRETFDRYGTYLITLDKIIEARIAARARAVPLSIVAGLYPGGVLTDVWAVPVTTATGEWVRTFHFEAKWSPTPATVNGGWVERLNAFIPFACGAWLPVLRPAPAVAVTAPLTAAQIFR
jgi:hypothetical protein